MVSSWIGLCEYPNSPKSSMLDARTMIDPSKAIESGAGCSRSPQLVLHHILGAI